MVRKHTSRKKQPIEWRSHEPNRLETFSDAVFAFALTLIIVSIEVPRSFDELFETLKGGISFAACFAMLFLIWNSQNVFFRRYGLNDPVTVSLNGILLFVVLIYVYPMKFLSQLLFTGGKYMYHGEKIEMIHIDQTRTLMIIYSIGYSVIYLLFFLMYLNARKQAQHLELTPKEAFETNTIAYINLISALIGISVILIAMILPDGYSGLSGFFYFVIPICYSVWFGSRGKRSRMLFGE